MTMTGHGKNSVCAQGDSNHSARIVSHVTTSNWTIHPKRGNAKHRENQYVSKIQQLFVGDAIDAEVQHVATTSKGMTNMTKPTTTRGDKVKHSFPHPGPHSKFVLLSVSSERVM